MSNKHHEGELVNISDKKPITGVRTVQHPITALRHQQGKLQHIYSLYEARP
jgi:hypothetical protein